MENNEAIQQNETPNQNQTQTPTPANNPEEKTKLIKKLNTLSITQIIMTICGLILLFATQAGLKKAENSIESIGSVVAKILNLTSVIILPIIIGTTLKKAKPYFNKKETDKYTAAIVVPITITVTIYLVMAPIFVLTNWNK